MKTLIKNARVIDGLHDAPLPAHNVIVEDGRIVSVSGERQPDADFDEVIDAASRTLIPGMMNCHVHLGLDGNAGERARDEMVSQQTSFLAIRALANAQKMLARGITLVRDVGAKEFEVISVRKAIDSGLVPGPRVKAAGQGLITTGGPFLGREVDGVDGVRAAARAQLKAGADWIKLFATMGSMNPAGRAYGGVFGAPTFSVEEMKAAVEVARAAGVGVAAHALGREGIANALKAGVTTLEHGVLADDDAISMMADNGVYLVPTIGRLLNVAENGASVGLKQSTMDRYRWMYDCQAEVLGKAYSRGVKIAFGTDGGTSLMPHDEVVLEAKAMQAAGMSPLSIIRSLTSVSSSLMGVDGELGTIAKGKVADLVLLDGDPLEDLGCLANVRMVMLNGRAV